MDEIEKAIRFFESDIEMNPLFTCKVNPDKTIDYVALAIQALQEKAERENSRPLTLEELKKMHGKPIWIKDFAMNQIECLQFDKIETAYIHTGDDLRFNQFGTETGIIRWCCKYGKTWLAYDHEPKNK